MEYDNTNRGVLFDNDRKTTDRHPDMTGKLNINGIDHWFSAWWKDGQRGEFLSLSLGAAVEQQQPQRQEAPPRRGNRPSNAPPSRPAPSRHGRPPVGGAGFDDMDDDLPPF